MSKTAFRPLALMAADTEDLEVMSSVLQDAVAKVGDLAWLPKERRFALVANRFVWEEGIDRKRGPFLRVRSGIHFDDVIAVRTRKLRREAGDAVISLLNIGFEGGENGGTVNLEFAGGGTVALDVEAINATLRDLTEPWRTPHRPDHGDA